MTDIIYIINNFEHLENTVKENLPCCTLFMLLSQITETDFAGFISV